MPEIVASDNELPNVQENEYGSPDVPNNDSSDEGLSTNDEELDEDNEDNDNTVRWEKVDISRLLEAYKQYEKDMKHAKKKKRVWHSISLSLAKKGTLNDAEKCQRKWLNLIRSYKKIKDNNKKTGRGTLKKFKYYDNMDKLLGKKPSCKEPFDNSTLDLGLENFDALPGVENAVAAPKIIKNQAQAPVLRPAKENVENKVIQTTRAANERQPLQVDTNPTKVGENLPETDPDSEVDNTIKIVKKKKIGNTDFFKQKLELLKEKALQKKKSRTREKKGMQNACK